MLNIIIVCGPDGSGKQKVLERVWKVLSHSKCGKHISDIDNPIDVVKSKDGVNVGVAKRMSESSLESLIENNRGLDILICSARKTKDARRYWDLIRQANGGYAAFLKWKEREQYRVKTEELLCRQILSCCHCFN